MNYYLDVLKKYAVFSGRARRAEYWYFALFNFLISVALIIAAMVLSGGNPQNSIGMFAVDIYMLAVLLPSVAVGVRRLHDIGKSGWWLLIAFVPFIGAIVLLIFHCTPGDVGANKYGPDPKSSEMAASAA